MKKVELTMDKQKQYEIIKALYEGRINKVRAVVKLGVTRRHVNRLLAKYAALGRRECACSAAMIFVSILCCSFGTAPFCLARKRC